MDERLLTFILLYIYVVSKQRQVFVYIIVRLLHETIIYKKYTENFFQKLVNSRICSLRNAKRIRYFQDLTTENLSPLGD